MPFDSAAVTARIREIMLRDHLPNVSVCIRGPEGTVYRESLGIRDLSGVPVTPRTVFGIASMSKSVTALCLCILESEGKLSLEDPVTKYFPDFRIPGQPMDLVTLRTLANHTSGIPPMEPLEWSIAMNSHRKESDWIRAMKQSAPNPMSTIREVMDYISSCPYPTVGAPGENMSYCNEGYAILSYVVDQAAGIPLEQYCHERIFKPLGMTRTLMDADAVSAREMAGEDMAGLFELTDDGELECDHNWSLCPPFRGSATVKSTAEDMAAYYRCLSLYGIHDGKQVLPREAVEAMVGASVPLLPQAVYGLGLYKRSFRGHVICEHGGGLHGVSTKGGLLLGEGYGFTVLCSLGYADVDEIMWCLYNAVAGLPLDTCHRWFIPAGREFADPDMLPGHYVGHEGIPDICDVHPDGRTVTVSHRLCRLIYCGGSRFLAVDPDDPSRIRSRLEFFFRRGHAWGVRVGSRIFTLETKEEINV